MKTPLDPFEAELLRELRSQVSQRSVRRPPALRFAAGLTLVGAAAAAFAVVATGTTPDPADTRAGTPDIEAAAFTVARQGDGDVVVTIRSLDQIDGLERALQDRGVEADIVHDPNAATSVNEMIQAPPDGDELVLVECQPLVIVPTEDGFTFTLLAEDVRSDRKLVLTTTGTNGDWSVARTRWEGIC